MQFFFQFFLFMWRERLCFHVLHYYNVPHVLFSQTALTLWQPFWLKSLADQYAEYYSLSIYQGFRLSRIQVKGCLLLAGVTSIQANLVSTNWRPHCNLSVGRTWYKITWVSVPKQYVLVGLEKKVNKKGKSNMKKTLREEKKKEEEAERLTKTCCIAYRAWKKKNSISSYALFFKYLHTNRSKSTNCCYAVLNLGILLNSHIC